MTSRRPRGGGWGGEVAGVSGTVQGGAAFQGRVQRGDRRPLHVLGQPHQQGSRGSGDLISPNTRPIPGHQRSGASNRAQDSGETGN